MKKTVKEPLRPYKLFIALKQQMLQGMQLAAEQQSNEYTIKWRIPRVHTYQILTSEKKKNFLHLCKKCEQRFKELYEKWLLCKEGRTRLN